MRFFFGRGVAVRRLVRALEGIERQLAAQTALLDRLATQFIPAPLPEPTPAEQADTGVSYLNEAERIVADTFVARTIQATGHAPTDDEILQYLADESTTALHRAEEPEP